MTKEIWATTQGRPYFVNRAYGFGRPRRVALTFSSSVCQLAGLYSRLKIFLVTWLTQRTYLSFWYLLDLYSVTTFTTWRLSPKKMLGYITDFGFILWYSSQRGYRLFSKLFSKWRLW